MFDMLFKVIIKLFQTVMELYDKYKNKNLYVNIFIVLKIIFSIYILKITSRLKLISQ